MVSQFFRPSLDRRRGGSFKLVVDNLYRNEASEEVSSTFSFDSEVITKALKNIYESKYHPMSEIEENLFMEFWNKLNFATDLGVKQSSNSNFDKDFRQVIQKNNAIFATFKTHRMSSDMSKLLLDSNGDLKPFEQWVKDVRPIADHQVYNWFKTEYVTAVNRARHAANWKEFQRTSEALPNLKWRPSTAASPREIHAMFYGLVLPINHPFWHQHSPGDMWNCQCGLLATDDERTPEDKIPAAGYARAKGLDNNPADDGKLINDSHPYFPSRCSTCKLNKSSKALGITDKLIYNAKNEKDCYECEKVLNLTFEAIKKAAKANIDELKSKIDMYNGYSIPKVGSPRGNVIFLRKSFKEITSHGGNKEEIQSLLAQFKFEDVDKWQYIGSAPHATSHPESENIHYYKYNFNGRIYYIITLAHKRYNGDVVHSIKLKEPVDMTK